MVVNCIVKIGLPGSDQIHEGHKTVLKMGLSFISEKRPLDSGNSCATVLNSISALNRLAWPKGTR